MLSFPLAIAAKADGCGRVMIALNANGDRHIPASRSFYLVSGEVKGVDFRLGQVVSSCHITLITWLRESWKRVDKVLFPSPGHDGTQILARLIRRSPRIRSFMQNSSLVPLVEKLADVLSPEPLDRNSTAPLPPLPRPGIARPQLYGTHPEFHSPAYPHEGTSPLPYSKSLTSLKIQSHRSLLQCSILLAGDIRLRIMLPLTSGS